MGVPAATTAGKQYKKDTSHGVIGIVRSRKNRRFQLKKRKTGKIIVIRGYVKRHREMERRKFYP